MLIKNYLIININDTIVTLTGRLMSSLDLVAAKSTTFYVYNEFRKMNI